MHSVDYREPAPFAGKRVLVVGGGNSACDIAAALSRWAAHVSISLRRPQYIVPKLIFGRPVDVQFAKLRRLPGFVRGPVARSVLRLVVGPYARYGLPEPGTAVLHAHPTLNSDILDRIRHGTVTPRRGVLRSVGLTVTFADGTSDAFDTIIWATGFRTEFPFFEEGVADWRGSTEVPLYLKMLPTDRDDLAFVGLIQPLGCIWALADTQARLVAALIGGRWRRPDDIAARVARETREQAQRFEASPRHAVEVDIHDYSRELSRELARAA
jgi:hypothetical protein